MKFTLDKTEQYTIFQLHNTQLNDKISSDLKSEFTLLATEGIRNLIIDLSEVKTADTDGLEALLLGNRLCKEKGGLFVLTNMNDSLLALLQITKVASTLYTVPTIHEGVEAVFLNEIESQLMAGEEADSEETQA